jgi:hypothetical protein
MMRTPAEIRAHAKTYRELHAYLQGPILTEAIEEVARALDQLAVTIERQNDAVRDKSGVEFKFEPRPRYALRKNGRS